MVRILITKRYGEMDGAGRPGAKGYSDKETEQLVTQVERRRPLAGKGWETVATRYNEWAQEHGYKVRTAKSLKTKFEAVCDHEVNVFSSRIFTCSTDGTDEEANRRRNAP